MLAYVPLADVRVYQYNAVNFGDAEYNETHLARCSDTDRWFTVWRHQTPHAEQVTIDLSKWTPPDIGVVGDDPFSKLVKYGHKLFTDTANEVGPSVPDPAKRLAGNNLACQNCHLRAGTQPYAMPLTGVWGQFPQYRAREGMVDTLEERINGCVQRSMNGRALSLESREIRAFSSYMRWLSTGVPDGAK